MRFGLEDSPSVLEKVEPKTVECREARAKRFGTKLVASRGEVIQLVDR